MTDPVKPISGKSSAPAPAQNAPKTVKIGGVTFNREQIEADKTTSFQKNGEKINCVFLKPGVKIEFPDQTNLTKNPRVQSIGLRSEWYNPDGSHIRINDLENATIYGAKNKSDYISLGGESSGNTFIMDEKESWYVNGDMRSDYVELGPNTENNTVYMDEADKTRIFYNQSEVIMNGETVQDGLELLQVEGKGESSQEAQLKDSLGDSKYATHKHLQNN